MTDAITVTGSRQVGTGGLEDLVTTALGGFVSRRRVWLLGGAIGIDQFVTEWLIARGERVFVVLPFTVDDQPSSVQSTLTKVERRIELRLKRTKKAYLDRNSYMVERSDTVVAFWNGERGGTWATVQSALKLHKQVHVYPCRGIA